MNSEELKDVFREDVVDTELPYLWTDDEVFRYMDAAYRMFVRKTVGISDITSTEATVVTVTQGEAFSDLHPSVLRIMSARLESTDEPIRVINMTDVENMTADDYKLQRSLRLDDTPGKIKYMIIGAEKDKARWVQVPEVDDAVNLHVYRLPLTHIVDGNHTLSEVSEDNHTYLLYWMKHLAYLKQDAETFDRAKSNENRNEFLAYCEQCRAEWERYKHKNRVVQYGGL